jgi:hypothetical protein
MERVGKEWVLSGKDGHELGRFEWFVVTSHTVGHPRWEQVHIHTHTRTHTHTHTHDHKHTHAHTHIHTHTHTHFQVFGYEPPLQTLAKQQPLLEPITSPLSNVSSDAIMVVMIAFKVEEAPVYICI